MTTPALRELGVSAASALISLVGLLAGAAAYAKQAGPLTLTVDQSARAYVRLVAALGARDPDTLDTDGNSAGPALPAVRVSFSDIATQAREVVAELRAEPTSNAAPDPRRQHLIAQFDAIATRAEQLGGRRFPIELEVRRLFGVTLRRNADAGAALGPSIAALDRLLPGSGRLAERVQAYDARFTVPADRVPATFERALAECRARTTAHVPLPAGESVTVEYVRDRPWSGHSRYLGGSRSRIEVNTTFPLTVDRILELACHEGYPGHHAYSTLRDAALVQGRGWEEFSVMPLFSPESFVAEAAAAMGATMAFSYSDRLAFERDVLFPVAGLDPEQAESYLTVAHLSECLTPSLASVVGRYLSGDLDFVEAGWALEDEALMAHPTATLQFVNEYRGYALAYTLGRTQLLPLIGPDVPTDGRWQNFIRLTEGGTPP